VNSIDSETVAISAVMLVIVVVVAALVLSAVTPGLRRLRRGGDR
jgi:hypothetical protein